MDQLAATTKKLSFSIGIPDQPRDISRRDVIKTLGLGIPAGILLASGKAFGETTIPGSETAVPGSTPEPFARMRTNGVFSMLSAVPFLCRLWCGSI